MLRKTPKPRNGFTIIEIMIVLAIAGLIMLIVFLAVPGLQRASRNTQRKNDASAIAAAVANYIDDNGGILPANTGTGGAAGTLTICGASCATGNIETATLGYYTARNVKIISLSPPTTPTDDTVYIDTGYSCDPTNIGSVDTSPRSAAILYAVETDSSHVAQQCLEQ
jgi:prepilin-type N-terminal cleavage/methylation domain-containing protein